MDYSKKQQELDLIKWVDSETKNYDTCGQYSYCKSCNKSEAYPCAYAYEKYTNSTSKTSTSKTTRCSKTTGTSYQTKTPSCKKTSTTKKSTCKKTSTTKSTKATAKAY